MSEITAKEERLIQRHCYAGQCVRVPSESLIFSYLSIVIRFMCNETPTSPDSYRDLSIPPNFL